MIVKFNVTRKIKHRRATKMREHRVIQPSQHGIILNATRMLPESRVPASFAPSFSSLTIPKI